MAVTLHPGWRHLASQRQLLASPTANQPVAVDLGQRRDSAPTALVSVPAPLDERAAPLHDPARRHTGDAAWRHRPLWAGNGVEQRASVWMPRRRDDLADRPRLDHLPGVHNDEVVSNL